MTTGKDKRFTFLLSEEGKENLEKIAARHRVSAGEWLRSVIDKEWQEIDGGDDWLAGKKPTARVILVDETEYIAKLLAEHAAGNVDAVPLEAEVHGAAALLVHTEEQLAKLRTAVSAMSPKEDWSQESLEAASALNQLSRALRAASTLLTTAQARFDGWIRILAGLRSELLELKEKPRGKR